MPPHGGPARQRRAGTPPRSAGQRTVYMRDCTSVSYARRATGCTVAHVCDAHTFTRGLDVEWICYHRTKKIPSGRPISAPSQSKSVCSSDTLGCRIDFRPVYLFICLFIYLSVCLFARCHTAAYACIAVNARTSEAHGNY